MNKLTDGNSPFDLDNADSYARWRDEKLGDYPASPDSLIVELKDFLNPGPAEVAALKERIEKTNMALYVCPQPGDEDDATTKQALSAFGQAFGLKRLDANLCADPEAISSLSVAGGGRRGRYIPYTNRPISWHTDGYYNSLTHQIRGMVLHCVRPAASGGANALMDPEIAYIKLRDENPDYIRTLMHPDAMLIPANDEGEGIIRQAQSGPVFTVDSNDGALHMRYTARTRSIEWRNDEATLAGVAFLEKLLSGNSPYLFRHRMAAGEGVLCNNVLHNRTAFEDDQDHQRLFLRARYFDRICV